MGKIFRVLRIITVPPVFALALLLTIFFMQPDSFMSVWQVLCGLFFLGVCTAPHLLDSLIYYLGSGMICYAKRGSKQMLYRLFCPKPLALRAFFEKSV